MNEQLIKEIIADVLQKDVDEITPEKSFTNDLGADSLDLVEIIMNIEDRFNIQVPDSEAENIQTVGDAFEKIKELIG